VSFLLSCFNEPLGLKGEGKRRKIPGAYLPACQIAFFRKKMPEEVPEPF
jgi:hypothetical protein